jgi:hypothetical protein
MSERRWSIVTLVVAGAGFTAFAAWRIPWHPVPGGTPSRLHSVEPGGERPVTQGRDARRRLGPRDDSDPKAFEQMVTALAVHALSNNPPAWSQFWFGFHLTTLERIAISRQIGRQQTRGIG